MCHKLDYFAFSVKLTGKNNKIDQKDYEPFFKRLYSLGKNIFKIAELDSKNRLHYHGVVGFVPGFYKKKLHVKGFHWKLVSIWNMHNWMSYCYKNYDYKDIDDHLDLICQEEILLIK